MNLRIERSAKQVTGFDTLNGVQQELTFEEKGGATEVRQVRVYDYPIILRLR